MISSVCAFISRIEVVEHACGMATLQMGEYVPNVSNGIDTYSVREPLGVCAGICPFNFPAMIPLWVKHSIFLLIICIFIDFCIPNITFNSDRSLILCYSTWTSGSCEAEI